MEKHGWRAIIYDAPWARFKSGQSGVIVSEDGLSCETTDDDKSNIIIEVDPNLTFENRQTGHALFRQKGSDLFDIVCLDQIAGGTYSLEVSNVTIDGCVGKTYQEFIRDLTIYEIVNNERKKVTDYDEKKSMLVKPTAADASNNFKNSTNSPITMSIVVSNNGVTANGTLTINSSGQESEEYVESIINGLDTPYAEKISDGSKYCTILGGRALTCDGGQINFYINSGNESYATYKVFITGITAVDKYNVVKCGEVLRTKEYPSTLSYTVVENAGISVIEQNSSYITISVNGVSSVKIIIETKKGTKKEINVSIPS